ncbi:putative metal-dependent HD superfamily phosphohydrolase [Arthrobacter pigmenti]|uniref:Putative metal-dependent HD superfamily phosphohydrolase n=1 Tax=Arthrobacter pigmenti TaxID=271432 RepID=A0A846RLL3_9MICC|nr:DUF4031 domain-containing protein [Arthrobacter pigmenti]NJC24113.1 putative metal-dependent HD superfamily phosphohydrolase [Arthrobacter pigmenti]
MAVYIDPPLWPAHGTVFSHLISDTSLAELHGFAARAGISERAFDVDHYDVPARRYRQLVRQGALEVNGGTLVRILISSGLRVPARLRPDRIRRALRARWSQTLPGHPALGGQLLDRWSEPHRRYHNPEHLLDVLEALDLLIDENDDDATRLNIRLAAWFHDAVYAGKAGEDEEASAALAEDQLTGVIPDPGEVTRLVRLTVTHDPDAGDRAGELLCDADLAVLGRSPAGYQRYVRAVREEYAHIPDAQFTVGRAAVVGRLLALDPLYRTERARHRWLASAHENLAAELATLRRSTVRCRVDANSDVNPVDYDIDFK